MLKLNGILLVNVKVKCTRLNIHHNKTLSNSCVNRKIDGLTNAFPNRLAEQLSLGGGQVSAEGNYS